MCVCVRVRHYDVWERKRTDERLGYNIVVVVLFVMSSSENLIYFFFAGALGWDCILVPWSSVAGLSRNTSVADSTNESNKEKTRRNKTRLLDSVVAKTAISSLMDCIATNAKFEKTQSARNVHRFNVWSGRNANRPQYTSAINAANKQFALHEWKCIQNQ